MPRLLHVDDDTDINDLIANYFPSYGFEVTCVQSGAMMHAQIALGGVDVVLLDLGLPGEDGLELARALRQTWNGPIIIVSGRGETIDRVVGLEVGADDYVTKPFDMRELLARVKSVMRRFTERDSPAVAERPASPIAAAADVSRYQFGDWVLNVGARSLQGGHGVEVILTRGEFDLLLALVERPQRVLSRDELIVQTHNRDAGPFDRTIDVQIGRLRRKMGDDPAQPQIIKAVRGLGYQFAMDVVRVPGTAR